jgi:hypothetical protein
MDGGGLYFDLEYALSSADLTCNRIVINTATDVGTAVYVTPETVITVTAQNNWWGSNSDPSLIPNLLVGPINSSLWITESLIADPPVVMAGDTTTIKATFSSDCIPNGTPVAFSTTDGTITPTLVTTVSGVAAAVLTLSEDGLPVTVTSIVGPDAEMFSLSLTLTPFVVRTEQQLNRFPRYADLMNVITWEPASFPVISYEIFLAPNLTTPLAVIPAGQPLSYVDHKRKVGVEYTYYIFALNELEELIELGHITVP